MQLIRNFLRAGLIFVVLLSGCHWPPDETILADEFARRKPKLEILRDEFTESGFALVSRVNKGTVTAHVVDKDTGGVRMKPANQFRSLMENAEVSSIELLASGDVSIAEFVIKRLFANYSVSFVWAESPSEFELCGTSSKDLKSNVCFVDLGDKWWLRYVRNPW